MTIPSFAALEQPLNADELKLLCDFVYRRTGMVYGENKRYFIERRVDERMAKTRIKAFPAYMTLLLSGSGEAEQLINSFTVNETYFYREQHQLQCLSHSLLPELIATRAPGDLIRIWSIPCATGEEPYSIAIWLLENWPLVDAYNIEIVGSDIDTRVLADASQGRYGPRALNRLPPDLVDRYFEPERDGMRQIIEDLRESIKLTHVNLIDASAMGSQGGFDVIFCRNVMIYFDDISRSDASRGLYDALKPGGFLCLGHTEFMSRISSRFATRRFPDAIVYQRAAS